MDAVGPRRRSDIRAVVDDEGDVALVADRAQPFGGAPEGCVVDALEAELDAGDIAGVERRGEVVGASSGIAPVASSFGLTR